MKKEIKNGFTFLELLIVVALIALISIRIVPIAVQSVKNSRVKALVNDMELIGTAVLSYCQVQEAQLAGSCKLEGAIDVVNGNVLKQDALNEIVDSNFPAHLEVKVYLKDSSWITPSGYGAVTVWYPKAASSSRIYKGNIEISSLGFPLKSSADISSWVSAGNNAMLVFTYDQNGDSQLDNETDFAVLCYYFKLNPGHSHDK